MRPGEHEEIDELVSNETLSENIIKNIEYVAILHQQAQNVHPPARTVYYKSATMFAASVVEALMYELVKRHSQEHDEPVSVRKSHSEVYPLPDEIKYGSSSKKLVIAERKQMKKDMEDYITFNDLNDYCKNHEILEPKEYDKLDYVREKRNQIHLQSLESLDTGYTKRQLNAVSSRIDMLMDKLKKI
jgi:hypothetical protein